MLKTVSTTYPRVYGREMVFSALALVVFQTTKSIDKSMLNLKHKITISTNLNL